MERITVKQLKILICIEMFVLGLFVGYGIYFLHWLADYQAPLYYTQDNTHISNVTTGNGYVCMTITSQQQNTYYNRTSCEKK